MAKVTLDNAELIAQKGRPWTIRLERYDQYWYATGRALHEAVELGFGTIGDSPVHVLTDWATLRTEVSSQILQGFGWADTPYIRMSPASIAKLSGVPATTPVPTIKAVKTTPAPAVIAAASTSNALQSLSSPYNMICSLKLVRTGIKVTGYAALDALGAHLCDFDAPTGLAFAQRYNLDVLFV